MASLKYEGGGSTPTSLIGKFKKAIKEWGQPQFENTPNRIMRNQTGANTFAKSISKNTTWADLANSVKAYKDDPADMLAGETKRLGLNDIKNINWESPEGRALIGRYALMLTALGNHGFEFEPDDKTMPLEKAVFGQNNGVYTYKTNQITYRTDSPQPNTAVHERTHREQLSKDLLSRFNPQAYEKTYWTTNPIESDARNIAKSSDLLMKNAALIANSGGGTRLRQVLDLVKPGLYNRLDNAYNFNDPSAIGDISPLQSFRNAFFNGFDTDKRGRIRY